MTGILANNDILSHEECGYLVSFLDSNKKWTPTPHYTWDGRLVELKDVDDPVAARFMVKAYSKIKSSLPSDFDAESFSLVVWHENTGLNLHTDDVGLEWRKYSSVVYLNDSFRGGRTEFPEQGVSVEPRTGMGIIFEAGDNHPHLVTEVSGGKRYTISSFWSNIDGHNLYKEWINENFNHRLS